jgi:hypothetical protein
MLMLVVSNIVDFIYYLIDKFNYFGGNSPHSPVATP